MFLTYVKINTVFVEISEIDRSKTNLEKRATIVNLFFELNMDHTLRVVEFSSGFLDGTENTQFPLQHVYSESKNV